MGRAGVRALGVSEQVRLPAVRRLLYSVDYLSGRQHLSSPGIPCSTSYGISLSSEPEREEPSKIAEWPTGVIVGNEFHGLYYGFYSYEARGVAIVGNRYSDCILYGIDPHDRSTELVIAQNTTTGTRERHGIIGSRGVSDSFILTTHPTPMLGRDHVGSTMFWKRDLRQQGLQQRTGHCHLRKFLEYHRKHLVVRTRNRAFAQETAATSW